MSSKKGFIKLIVLTVFSVAILSIMGVSLRDFARNDLFRDNIAFAWEWAGERSAYLWNTYGGTVKEYVQQFFNR